MGELKPCPFCGGDADISQIGNEATKTRGYEVKCRTFGCSTTKRSMVVKHTLSKAREWAVERWNTRPRTEGRGEGEHADQLQDVLAALYKAWPDAEDIPSDWPLGIIGCIEQIIAERDAALASPIREPEISRTALIETMRQHIKADAVGLAPAVIAHCLVGFEEAADAILNLAPVGGRGEEGSARAELSPASRSPDQHSDGGRG